MALWVDEESILQPLGLTVLRDSRYELLPSTRDYFEKIPGRHGEIDFGAEFEARVLELHCCIEINPSDWPAKRQEIARYLNPLLGTQTLTFADEPGKVYHVRYSGNIDITNYLDGKEFTIPFRMCDPFITSEKENQLTGSGTATNAGNVETPFILIIHGPATNPSVTVGGYVMTYTGTIGVNSELIVDTEKLTATLDGQNALPNYNGVFPKLQPGDNTVVAATEGTTIIKWYDRWI
ncbi:MAG: distal tail protein Dit [Thermacetogeniaceae bacterium]